MKQTENEMNVNVPLEVIKASEIEPKEVKWLWYPYIPFGKVTLLQVEEAARRIREEKEKAIREVRSEIADLSIAIAEKVMKEKISRDKEQQQIIDRLLDEVSFCKS